MKLICPYCKKSQNIGEQSRYCVFECSCGEQWRGIHADVAMLDFAINTFTFIGCFRGGYDHPRRTGCPHCFSSVWVEPPASSCWRCGNDLPTDKIPSRARVREWEEEEKKEQEEYVELREKAVKEEREQRAKENQERIRQENYEREERIKQEVAEREEILRKNAEKERDLTEKKEQLNLHRELIQELLNAKRKD